MKWKLMLAASLMVVACGDDDPKNNGSNNTQTNNQTNNGTNNTNNTNNSTGARASFATYNVGLATGFVPLAEERRETVTNAIPTIDADVVCLQEVWLNDVEGEWTQDALDGIIAAASTSHPHAYYVITEDEGAGVGCTPEEVEPLETCVVANCDGVAPADLSGCVITNCSTEFGAVSSECSACLVGQLGNSFEDIKTACVGDTQAAYYSNGHNGLLMLSKYPLTEKFHERMEAVQVSRSILAATTELPEIGSMRVYCTHLTAEITGVAYPGDDFESYEAEQKVQVERLITLVGAETLPTLVLGDFNTGPDSEKLDAELPANYALLKTANWLSLYLDLGEGECTYCATNTLVSDAGAKNIDHIFAFGFEPEDVQSERLFVEPVTIGAQTTNLSDHYGVRASFQIAAQ